jgi:hypothetical protein
MAKENLILICASLIITQLVIVSSEVSMNSDEIKIIANR